MAQVGAARGRSATSGLAQRPAPLPQSSRAPGGVAAAPSPCSRPVTGPDGRGNGRPAAEGREEEEGGRQPEGGRGRGRGLPRAPPAARP